MDERRETVTTPEGRRLEVRIAGPEGGPTIVAHPGTPDAATAPWTWLFSSLAGGEDRMREEYAPHQQASAADAQPRKSPP